MGSRRAELPTVDVAQYRCAIGYAVRLAKEREREHRRKVERFGFATARAHRQRLEELAELVEGE